MAYTTQGEFPGLGLVSNGLGNYNAVRIWWNGVKFRDSSLKESTIKESTIKESTIKESKVKESTIKFLLISGVRVSSIGRLVVCGSKLK